MERLPNIPTVMNAVMCHGPYDYRYEQVPVPTINEDEILIKVDC